MPGLRAALGPVTLASILLASGACHAPTAGPPAPPGTTPGVSPGLTGNAAPTRLSAAQFVTKASGALCDDAVQCLYLDRHQRVWVGTATGLATYENGTWSPQVIKSRDPVFGLFSKNRGPDAFDEDASGRLVMAGRFGVRVRSEDTWHSMKPACPIRPDLLLCDRRGDIWAAIRGSGELWRHTAGKWQLALEQIDVPLEIRLVGSKGGGRADYGYGLHEIGDTPNGHIWIAAHGANPTLNPDSMPREREGEQWTRPSNGYAYEWYDGGRLGVLGAAPIAPIAPFYVFDGERWRAPKTDLRDGYLDQRHDDTLRLMTEQGPCDPVTLQPFGSDAPADALGPLLCRVHAHGGGEWLVTAKQVILSRPGHVDALPMRANDHQALTTLKQSGFVCGLDDGNGNLWLATKTAGLLQWRYR